METKIEHADLIKPSAAEASAAVLNEVIIKRKKIR
jgi:hypothetical protein